MRGDKKKEPEKTIKDLTKKELPAEKADGVKGGRAGPGTQTEDEVYIGHNVTFINDVFPRATTPQGMPKGDRDWHCVATRVRHRASIGSGATLLCGVGHRSPPRIRASTAW